jgi:UDP-4-amino-4,6-dideoxy-N-acetyl-beta-L-altrosamine N-acetyltransferase
MITLREIARSDLPQVNAWRHDPRVISSLSAPFRYIGLAVDEHWYETYLLNRDHEVRCGILTPEGQLVGVVSLIDIEVVHRSAEFHIMVGPDSQGKGVGTAATAAMLEHAFGDLNLHRVYLTVLESNKAAIHVYEKTGFRREGTMRECVFKNGSYQNMIAMSVLVTEFRHPA